MNCNLISKDNILEVLRLLEIQHPNAVCELDYNSEFELLVAVILSAQCTDKRVNLITKQLFKDYKEPYDFANMQQEVLEKYIYSCGFYHNKAKNIIVCSKDIVKKHNGKVPNNIKDLINLAGVGKKTANVVVSEAFGQQAIAVDTHVLRLANRLQIADSRDPLKVEQLLMELIPKQEWSKSHHLFIHHGRYICKSRTPNCNICCIKSYCSSRICQ